ncbi:hypothetical protein [Roseicella aerolata]|uniref:Uncharacterized protein n=1 Tax=Roseicella aerolata TaxID=2883479 RepID=A0A9X1IGL9_9PROT|nr:hypothetical protein [Roseicella aerolata]MCB4824284.1 hypothetical protein [Roseicella aerolata]
MSTTAPNAFNPTPRPTASRRFPMPFLEWGGGALFARFGRLEVYARPECPGAWFVLREPGSVEVATGRYRVTIARVPSVRGGA